MGTDPHGKGHFQQISPFRCTRMNLSRFDAETTSQRNKSVGLHRERGAEAVQGTRAATVSVRHAILTTRSPL